MIGKIKKGSGFKGCVNYVLDKEQATLLHAEGVLAESNRDIIICFRRTFRRFYWKKRTGNKSKCIGWTLCHCNFTCIMHCNDDFWTYGAKTFGSRKRRRDGSSFFFYCLCGTDCLFSANLAFNCRVTYASSFMWC